MKSIGSREEGVWEVGSWSVEFVDVEDSRSHIVPMNSR